MKCLKNVDKVTSLHTRSLQGQDVLCISLAINFFFFTPCIFICAFLSVDFLLFLLFEMMIIEGDAELRRYGIVAIYACIIQYTEGNKQ